MKKVSYFTKLNLQVIVGKLETKYGCEKASLNLYMLVLLVKVIMWWSF